MFSKYSFVAIALLIILVLLRLFTLEKQADSDNFKLQGQISSNPYLSYDKIVFNIGRYRIKAPYQNLQYADQVQVIGKKQGFEIEAKEVLELKKGRLETWVFNFRKDLEKRINRHFPKPQSELLSGILLGVKSNLSREFKAALVATGTIHVVVVSGYNIVLLASFILLLAPFFGRKKVTFLALVTIVLYTVLVGFSAPTLRALIMGSVTLLAVLLGKRTIAIYSLIVAALIMLLINPEYIFDISFQLTFAATLGVLLFTKAFERKLNKFPKWFRETLATTLAAQSLVIPLLFYYFGTVSLLSPVVNTLVLWTIPVGTVLGFAFLGLTFISNFLADLCSYLLILPLTFFTRTVDFFGTFRILVLSFEKGNLMLVLGYYLIFFSLLPKFLKTRLKKQ